MRYLLVKFYSVDLSFGWILQPTPTEDVEFYIPDEYIEITKEEYEFFELNEWILDGIFYN